MKRALVWHGGALGDLITTMPAIRFWRDRLAIEHVTLIAHPEHGRLALRDSLANELISRDDRRVGELFVGISDPTFPTTPFGAFDRALLFTDPDGALVRSLTSRGIPCDAHAPIPPGSRPTLIRASRYHLNAVAAPASTDAAPRIATKPVRHAHPAVAINPGAGAVEKCWPADRFRQVGQSLIDRGLDVIWCLGAAELERGLDEQRPPGARVVSGLSTVELADLLAGVSCVLGNDSGTSHLAAAVGTPVVALFGPTDPRVWQPVGWPEVVVRVIRSASFNIEEIDPVEVTQAVCESVRGFRSSTSQGSARS